MSKGNFRTSSDVCVACGTTAQPIKPYGFDKRQPCYLCDRCSIRLKLPSLLKEESMAKLTKADAKKMTMVQLTQLIHRELGYTEEELEGLTKDDIISTLVDNGTFESVSKAKKLLNIIEDSGTKEFIQNNIEKINAEILKLLSNKKSVDNLSSEEKMKYDFYIKGLEDAHKALNNL